MEEKIVIIYNEMAKLEEIDLTQDGLLEESLQYIKKQFKINYLSYQHQGENLSIVKNDNEYVSIQNLNFGTVHSVKGETHKATLLVESKVKRGFRENTEIFYDCSEIFSFLMGEYYDYRNERKPLAGVIRDALKTAYVALSRPTHLAVVAINVNNLGDDLDEKQKQAKKAGWVVINVE